MSQKIFKLTKL